MQGPHYHTYTSIHTPRYTENAKPDFVHTDAGDGAVDTCIDW